jgi:hypothetical protein
LSEQHLKSEKILTVRSKICDYKQRKSASPSKEIAYTVDPKLTEVINKIKSIKESVLSIRQQDIESFNFDNPFKDKEDSKSQNDLFSDQINSWMN